MIRSFNIQHIIVLVICSVITSACVRDKSDRRDLLVENNSSGSIYSILSPDDTMFGLGHYEEFREGSRGAQPGFEFRFDEIGPGMKTYQHDGPRSWDAFFEKTPDKKIRLYIVSRDLVKKFGWEKIFNDNIYSKKIKVTREELNRKNWLINYSGK